MSTRCRKLLGKCSAGFRPNLGPHKSTRLVLQCQPSPLPGPISESAFHSTGIVVHCKSPQRTSLLHVRVCVSGGAFLCLCRGTQIAQRVHMAGNHWRVFGRISAERGPLNRQVLVAEVLCGLTEKATRLSQNGHGYS